MKNIQTSGFSLIELMTVVGIIAILGAVGIPSYNQYVTKSRRAQATTTLTQAFNNFQSFYAANNTYTGAPLPPNPQYYTLSVINATSGTFTLVATPTFSDPSCTSITLDQSGNQCSTPPGTAGTTTPAVPCASNYNCWVGQ